MFRRLILAVLLCAPVAAHAGALQFTGKGFQVYACAETGGAYAWRLKAPDAVLFDAAGKEAGKHFAGPSWQAPDGSTILGEALVTSPAPQAGAIPWLVLHVKSHTGVGVFAGVTYVSRSQTEGGVAPATGCDAPHANAETRIPYTATYVLYGP